MDYEQLVTAIDSASQALLGRAAQAVNQALVVRNWLRFFADCAAKKWPLRGSKSNDLRHKNIFGALKARSQGKHKELQLLRRMFICKTCQIP